MKELTQSLEIGELTVTLEPKWYWRFLKIKCGLVVMWVGLKFMFKKYKNV